MLRLAVLAVALALASASFQAQWAVFKHKHGKQYDAEEEVLRRYIYQSNLKLIEDHNEKYANGEVSFYLGENQFADMTSEEFAFKMNKMNLNVELPETVKEIDVSDLPTSVDWREKGYVTDIKNQGECGSCWAFSTTGSLEGQHFKSTGKLVSLSESNLVDCSQKEGNEGCDGGLMDLAFKYVIDNKGIDTEESYPYKPEDRKCAFKSSDVGATISSFKDIEHGSESALQEATAKIGPISVAIDAGHDSFQLYSGGVYNEESCSSTQLDHGVLVVGYGTDSGKDFWLVKNSWGTSWGMQGYIEMSRNKKNQCGIATKASYPII